MTSSTSQDDDITVLDTEGMSTTELFLLTGQRRTPMKPSGPEIIIDSTIKTPSKRTPKKPHTPKTPKAAKTPRAPKTPRTPKTPKNLQTPKSKNTSNVTIIEVGQKNTSSIQNYFQQTPSQISNRQNTISSLGVRQQTSSAKGNTVGENIIATTKIRNNYVTIKSFIFPILLLVKL